MYDCRNIKTVKKIGRTLFLALLILILLSSNCLSSPEGSENAAVKKSQAKMITGIMVTGNRTDSTDDTGRILVSANGELNYTSVKQYDPIGIILLFPNTTLGSIQPEYTPDSNIISSIKTSMSPDQANVRLEVVLKKDLSYSIKRVGTDIEILFQGEPEISPAEEAPASMDSSETVSAEDIEPAAQITMRDVDVDREPPPIKEEITPKSSSVSRIDFSSMESGKSSIIIGTTYPAKYEINKISNRTLKIRLFNSRLPEFRKHRPLITTRFESAVDRITPIQKDDDTDIIVELREWVPYRSVREGKLLTLYFDASSIGPRPFESAKLPSWQQVLGQVTLAESSEEGDIAVPEKVATVEEQYLAGIGQQKKYTGQKIALDFYKTDIKNVFRILQQISGKNFVVDKNVNGQVTISLETPVPWDQVFDLILRMNHLGKIEQGDIVRIVTQNTLKKEEQLIEQKLKALRKRKAEQRKLEPLITEYIPINYANAGSEIKPHIKDIQTKRGKLSVDKRNNQLILTDIQSVIDRAHEIISKIDKVTPQVLIEARIVEVSESFTREVGLSWDVSGEDIYNNDLDGQYSYGIAMNMPKPEDANLKFNFSRLDAWGTPVVLDAVLKAMEISGNGKIISSPRILTLNNKKATIKKGRRVPYQELSSEGVPTTKFQDVDLSLVVTPQITPDNRINLKVKTTKNEILGFTPLGQPEISTNEATTELLVENGDTIVIGGVINTDIKDSESGFPILKDIPMIGWLFKTVDTTNSKQELLIFLTPTIVQLEQKNLVQVEN